MQQECGTVRDDGGGRKRGVEEGRGRRLYAGCTGAAVEVVRALLVACSRTYTLDRTFDLGSRGIADDLGPCVTGYVEREAGGSGLVGVERNGELDLGEPFRQSSTGDCLLFDRTSGCSHSLDFARTISRD